MTTKVTVDAHAGWDVEVTQLDQHQSDCATHNAPALPVGECDCFAGARAKIIVPAGFAQDFYVTDARTLLIKEIKK